MLTVKVKLFPDKSKQIKLFRFIRFFAVIVFRIIKAEIKVVPWIYHAMNPYSEDYNTAPKYYLGASNIFFNRESPQHCSKHLSYTEV